MPRSSRMRPLPAFCLVLAVSLCLVSCSQSPSIVLEENKDAITFKRGSQTILVYNKSVQQPPEGIDPLYARSGYIHPVFTPKGRVATGDFSEDHAHQHGIFMAWTNTLLNGQKIDFWNPHVKLGRVEHNKVVATKQGADHASFTVIHDYIAAPEGQKETLVLKETWTTTARQGSDDHFLFDIVSEHRLVGDAPLLLPEYRYGGMAIRGNNLWTPLDENPSGTCEFLTSNGDTRIEGNHTKTRWVAMSGMLEGQPVTIAVLDHPDNFRSPQSVRIHPKMPYFTFAPMVDGDFSIEPGETYTSRYRYLVSDAKPDPKWLDAQWNAYAKAPLD